MAQSIATSTSNGTRLLGLAIAVALAAALLGPKPSQATTGDPVLINEALVSHTGTPDDTEYVELYGTPGTPLAGLSLLVVEGDSAGAGAGFLDRRLDFAPDARLGGNGFFLVGNPTGLANHYKVVPDLAIGDDWFENGSQTLALARSDSVGVQGSLVTGTEVVLDAVGLADSGVSDAWYFDAPVVGPDDGFLAPGARRVADGVDTDSSADWVMADDLLGAANTPTPATPYDAPPTTDCGAPLAAVAGTAVPASVSATDPDGRVMRFELALTPDPGTVLLGSAQPATAPGETATVLVEVGADTPAGSYSAEVTAWTDATVPQHAACELAIHVAAPTNPAQPTLDDLVARVEARLGDGSVHGSKAGQLMDRLARVVRFAERSQDAAVAAQLRAFANQLRGLSPKWISPAAAEELAGLAATVADGM
jgi:FIMAH domain